MSEVAESRCPACGALAGPDASWCGQCFSPLGEPEPAPAAVSARGMPGKAATWPCPTCSEANALDLDSCAFCATPFGALLGGQERPRDVDPKDALAVSLIFPGLGHRIVGRGADGLARAVLFAMTASMTLLVLLSGVRPGPVAGILLIYGGAMAMIYIGSAFEAYRLAQGGRPFVSSRTLLWVTVGVLGASMLMIAFVVAAATSG